MFFFIWLYDQRASFQLMEYDFVIIMFCSIFIRFLHFLLMFYLSSILFWRYDKSHFDVDLIKYQSTNRNSNKILEIDRTSEHLSLMLIQLRTYGTWSNLPLTDTSKKEWLENQIEKNQSWWIKKWNGCSQAKWVERVFFPTSEPVFDEIQN